MDDGPVTELEQHQLAEALSRHLADGRLDLEQFDTRVATVYRATTRVGARAALDGLPLLPAPSPSEVQARAGGRRRHGEPTTHQDHWVATDEVFRDPTTGRVMRVWVDPTDGTRHYVGVAS